MYSRSTKKGDIPVVAYFSSSCCAVLSHSRHLLWPVTVEPLFLANPRASTIRWLATHTCHMTGCNKVFQAGTLFCIHFQSLARDILLVSPLSLSIGRSGSVNSIFPTWSPSLIALPSPFLLKKCECLEAYGPTAVFTSENIIQVIINY